MYKLFFLCAVVLLGVLVVIIYIPKAQVKGFAELGSKEQAELENNFRKTIVEAVGGLVVIVGLFATLQSLGGNLQALKLERDSKNAERLATAVEQLGSDNAAVRRGAVYSLSSLAKSSMEVRSTALALLTAAVRENRDLVTGPPPAILEMDSIHIGDLPKGDWVRPTVDRQAALTILGRLDNGVRKDLELDLRTADIRGADLRDLDLHGALLHLADVRGATMQRVNLDGAQVHWTNLGGSYGTGSTFRKALIQGADFSGASYQNAVFDNAGFKDAKFVGTILWGASLRNAAIIQSNFTRGILVDADLSGSAVANSVFDEAILHGTNLQGLKGWKEIKSIKGAMLTDLKNAPEGFVEWALQHGAIKE